MDRILEINGLCKRYPQFCMENVSFSLERGYIMGLVGRNGAGKTTVIRSILDMTFLDRGSISVFGLDHHRDSRRVKDRIGVVFDSPYFPLHLRVPEIEAQLCGFYSQWDHQRFCALTERFALPMNQKVRTFSKGMMLKLMVAIALAHKAELLILDEPTSGLDPASRDELLELLMEYIADGTGSVLFSTHFTADIERIADFVTVLELGTVQFTGTKDDLLERYVILKGDPDALPEHLKAKTIGYHTFGGGFEAMLETADLVPLPEEIDYEKANLDELLIFMAKEEQNHG